MSLFMREEREREREREERDLPRRLVFSCSSYPLSWWKMTFEKRKNTKKYKSGERARRMPPALNGEKRRIFLLSLSLFDEYSGCSMIRKLGLSNRSKFICRARLPRRRRDASLRRSSNSRSSKKFVRIVCESIHM